MRTFMCMCPMPMPSCCVARRLSVSIIFFFSRGKGKAGKAGLPGVLGVSGVCVESVGRNAPSTILLRNPEVHKATTTDYSDSGFSLYKHDVSCVRVVLVRATKSVRVARAVWLDSGNSVATSLCLSPLASHHATSHRPCLPLMSVMLDSRKWLS
jgi:hypothetical protein